MWKTLSYCVSFKGISLYHMLKLAQYNATSIQVIPNDAKALVRGIINKSPREASKRPLSNTQNLGDGRISGTIG
ncbi:MAG: hypothetical protein QNL81_00120, partial [Euryarchaeota archaeon]